MIKANELRIGNLVLERVIKYFDDGEPNEAVLKIKDGAMIDRVAAMANPIPLTSEILEACGFEKGISEDDEERVIYSIQVANNTSLYFDRHKDWMRNDQEVEWYLSHEWNNNHFKNDFWARPKYLHQLQNLFFSLTGEELTVNIPVHE